MKAAQLTKLRKVLDELAVKFPSVVTPAYIERRIDEEQTTLDAAATAQPITQSEELE